MTQKSSTKEITDDMRSCKCVCACVRACVRMCVHLDASLHLRMSACLKCLDVGMSICPYVRRSLCPYGLWTYIRMYVRINVCMYTCVREVSITVIFHYHIPVLLSSFSLRNHHPLNTTTHQPLHQPFPALGAPRLTLLPKAFATRNSKL